MALELPDNAEQLANKSRTDVQNALGGSNPFAKNHWLGALITAFCNRVFDFYEQLINAIDANIPDTAFGEYLQRWLAIFKIAQLQPTKAIGFVVTEGTIGASVSTSDVYGSQDGLLYDVVTGSTITTNNQAVDNIERSGQVATVTFLDPHELASGITVTISGADQPEYNGDFSITVISDNEYQYNVTGSPVTPATGTIDSEHTTARPRIQSQEAGSGNNLDAGATVSLQSPIVGVNNDATVDAGAIGGGSDEETEEQTRERLIKRIQNPVAHYNEGDIEALALTVNGVTRVFVQTPSTNSTSVTVTLRREKFATSGNTVAEATIDSGTFPFFSGQPITITGSSEGDYNLSDVECIIATTTTLLYYAGTTAQDPAGTAATIEGSDVPLGTTRVYFMRDNDTDPIPTASEVFTVNEVLQTIRPANTSENDLVVSAPVANEIDFTFANLTPNSTSMQDAIVDSLKQMMIDRADVGGTITKNVYESVITNTYDPETGRYVQSFELSTPTTNIVSATGEIAVLGTVTYP